MNYLGEKAVRLLGGVVDEGTLSAYLCLLTAGGCPSEKAAELLGGPDQVQTLINLGMAEVRGPAGDQPPHIIPAAMDSALQRTLAALTREVLTDHERLVDGYQRMCDLSAFTTSPPDRSMEQLVQIITDSDEVKRLTGTLLGSVQRDWLTLSNSPTTGPEKATRDTSAPSPVKRGARYRAIYEASCTDEAMAREKLEAMVESGAHVRLLPRIHMSMVLADEAISLVPLTSSKSGGALLIQSSVVVGALREYSELLWERAMPLGVSGRKGHTLPQIRMKILRLLVEGLPDEAVAQRVDLSLTTVRRHIKSIREELGTETRFELGVVAVQQGLVD